MLVTFFFISSIEYLAQEDPYIGFDDAEHPYAANIVEINTSNNTFNLNNPKHNKMTIINNLSSSSSIKPTTISKCSKAPIHSSRMYAGWFFFIYFAFLHCTRIFNRQMCRKKIEGLVMDGREICAQANWRILNILTSTFKIYIP